MQHKYFLIIFVSVKFFFYLLKEVKNYNDENTLNDVDENQLNDVEIVRQEIIRGAEDAELNISRINITMNEELLIDDPGRKLYELLRQHNLLEVENYISKKKNKNECQPCCN